MGSIPATALSSVTFGKLWHTHITASADVTYSWYNQTRESVDNLADIADEGLNS